MAETILKWHEYRYFPYEKDLALREVRELTHHHALVVGDGVKVAKHVPPDVARRFTYFATVESSRHRILPNQARLEASCPTNGNHAGGLRRQSTRYSAHGLHEYRGKFNPQVVRAIGNILGIPRGALVLDPFCGSGTVLLEAAHIGWNAAGIDSNPLAVEIANAKICAFHTPEKELRAANAALRKALLNSVPPTERPWVDGETIVFAGPKWETTLPSLGYLKSWFPRSVLAQISGTLSAIERVVPKKLRGLFRVILSDVLREVSWQDPDDLRIRRRKSPAENYPAVWRFLDDAQAKIERICAANGLSGSAGRARQHAVVADARRAPTELAPLLRRFRRRRFDCAMTSPPYATALPYIDTQRLSLCALGMIASDQIREYEQRMIGNREIGTRQRSAVEYALSKNKAGLPNRAIKLCRQLLEASRHSDNGFRRRSMPALVYKYLSDMATVFGHMKRVLRRNGPFALIAGRNQTTLGGTRFTIDTPHLLADLAQQRGFSVAEMIEFNTYQRYGIHQRNSIRTESLLILRA